MSSDDRIENIAQQLQDTGLTRKSPLRGCSDSEIQSLESRYDLVLPASYRSFLQLMGHCTGGLARNSPELLFPAVLERTEAERDRCRRVNNDQQDLEDRRFFARTNKLLSTLGFPIDASEVPDHVHYSFPDDGLIIYADDLPRFWTIPRSKRLTTKDGQSSCAANTNRFFHLCRCC